MNDENQSAFINVHSGVLQNEGRETPPMYPMAPSESEKPADAKQYLFDIHYGKFDLDNADNKRRLEEIVTMCANKRDTHFITREELLTTKDGTAYVILTWVIRTPLKKPPRGVPDPNNNPEAEADTDIPDSEES